MTPSACFPKFQVKNAFKNFLEQKKKKKSQEGYFETKQVFHQLHLFFFSV